MAQKYTVIIGLKVESFHANGPLFHLHLFQCDFIPVRPDFAHQYLDGFFVRIPVFDMFHWK
jgi:hypothetical protein